MNIIKNSKGITLLELLAVLVIGTIFSLLAFNILFDLMKTEERVKSETQLRDTADFYLARLSRWLYVLNEGDVCGDLQHSEEPGNTYSYIQTGDCDNSSNMKVTGFFRNSDALSLYIEGVEIKAGDDRIKIGDSSYIEKDKNIYSVSLTLLYNGKSKTFKAEVQSMLNE